MSSTANIKNTYNKVAVKYAEKFMSELDGKPLDHLLLRSFYEDNKEKGPFIDLGCGPGQTTKFLADCGCANITGTDLSPGMMKIAKKLNPTINFEVADMLDLKYKSNTFGAATGFYCIVHFDYPAIKIAFEQINRILKPGGQLLISFHTGNEVIHFDEFLEEKADIDFYFLDADKVITLLKETGFNIVDALVRYPYPTEHPTKRAYIRTEKPKIST
jgi:ubiquinone/menaquinone biosynthesis C-methylase UbiE